MLQMENRLTAPVPKLDGRRSLEILAPRRPFGRLRGHAALAVLAGSVVGTVLWLGLLGWCLFFLAHLLVG